MKSRDEIIRILVDFYCKIGQGNKTVKEIEDLAGSRNTISFRNCGDLPHIKTITEICHSFYKERHTFFTEFNIFNHNVDIFVLQYTNLLIFEILNTGLKPSQEWINKIKDIQNCKIYFIKAED